MGIIDKINKKYNSYLENKWLSLFCKNISKRLKKTDIVLDLWFWEWNQVDFLSKFCSKVYWVEIEDDIKFEDKFFDVVYSSDSIHLSSDIKVTIKKIYDVLKDDGVFYLKMILKKEIKDNNIKEYIKKEELDSYLSVFSEVNIVKEFKREDDEKNIVYQIIIRIKK